MLNRMQSSLNLRSSSMFVQFVLGASAHFSSTWLRYLKVKVKTLFRFRSRKNIQVGFLSQRVSEIHLWLIGKFLANDITRPAQVPRVECDVDAHGKFVSTWI